LPFITTWDDSRNHNHPTNSAEEAKISTDPHFTEKLEANLSARAGQFVRVLPFSREGLLFSVDSDTTTNMQVLFNHLT
jgi:hypothetical protein